MKAYPGFRPKTWKCGGHLIDLRKPAVMGIINATPDSFHAESRFLRIDEALKKAENMIQAGAAIIDVGGASSRPGAREIEPDEEISRVIPLIEAIVKTFPKTPISIDTDHSLVAQAAIDVGAVIVNDVSAGSRDPELIKTVASSNASYVLMHRKGPAAMMQQNPEYDNVVAEVFQFLKDKKTELKAIGISEIAVDPGFGFGKNQVHNYQLLKGLDLLFLLESPILVGVSRKSMATKLLEIPAQEALNATTALHVLALENGADILRVHDVKEAIEAIQIWNFYRHTPIDLFANP